MSQLKKALQQLAQNQEFYATEFLARPLYQTWQKNTRSDEVEKFVQLMQADIYNEQQLTHLLKQQPALIKLILHRDHLSQIRYWYQQHASAEFKRQKRQYIALVDTLYVLCARYKKQLRHLILTASQGRIGILLEDKVLTEEKRVVSNTHTGMPLNPAQHQQLKRVLKQYQTTVKLEKTLMGNASAYQKLYQFMQLFYLPETQNSLHQHRPFGVMKLFKKRFAIFQFESWLTKKPLADDYAYPLDQTLLNELAEQTKKIAL